jgi:hypothetical protein
MNRDEILQRRADLARQLEQARAQRRAAEERLKDAHRLVDSIDGALQENGYWFDGLIREELAKAAPENAIRGDALAREAAGGE